MTKITLICRKCGFTMIGRVPKAVKGRVGGKRPASWLCSRCARTQPRKDVAKLLARKPKK